jgi:Ca-activated chloride channel family protein
MAIDDEILKRALRGEEPPPADAAALGRAVAAAGAAFDGERRRRKKIGQGSWRLGRLIFRSDDPERRRPMKSTFVYGSVATVMMAALTAGVAVYYQHGVELAQRRQVADAEHVEMAQTEGTAPATPRATVPASGQPPAEAAPPIAAGAPAPTPPATVALMQQRQFEATRGFDLRMSQASPRSAAIAGAAQSMQKAEPAPPHYRDVGRDRFQDIDANPVKVVGEEPVSTFSIDVDTASYAFIRRQLNRGVLPQEDAVRIEEMLNYFDYAYPLPETREAPFRASVAVVPAPWAKGRKLVHIGIKGYDVAAAEKPRSNLVFLVDVSGSMQSPDKLPLVKASLALLLDSLGPDDTVGIVTYAGAAGKVLDPTPVKDKAKILEALDNLHSGGSTAGGEGIRQAYALAEAHFDAKAVNRVILATDGDFNVGITSIDELQDFVERKRKTGIYLSVLGFGQGNLNDRLMQALAQNGNGVAAHIDTLNEARKVLVEQASGTLFPIATDVKIQVEFNPATVAEYRLIGYETRALRREDFNNDAVDAGDIGSGHTVTALYEITPVGGPRQVEGSRYRPESGTAPAAFAGEYAFVKIRYKLPGEDSSRLISRAVTTGDDVAAGGKPPESLVHEADWAAAVAAFGQILAGGRYTGGFTHDDVIALAQRSKGDDPFGYRAEFLQLVRLAKSARAMPAE